jgi:hypothetical protein
MRDVPGRSPRPDSDTRSLPAAAERQEPRACPGEALVILTVSLLALAHVKWFRDPDPYPLRTDLIVSWTTALALGVSKVAHTDVPDMRDHNPTRQTE